MLRVFESAHEPWKALGPFATAYSVGFTYPVFFAFGLHLPIKPTTATGDGSGGGGRSSGGRGGCAGIGSNSSRQAPIYRCVIKRYHHF
jgi:hypothetical protein